MQCWYYVGGEVVVVTHKIPPFYTSIYIMYPVLLLCYIITLTTFLFLSTLLLDLQSRKTSSERQGCCNLILRKANHHPHDTRVFDGVILMHGDTAK